MAVEIPKPPRQSPVFAAITLERGDHCGVTSPAPGIESRTQTNAGCCVSNRTSAHQLRCLCRFPRCAVFGVGSSHQIGGGTVEKTNSGNSDRCYCDPWSRLFQDVRVNSKPA